MAKRSDFAQKLLDDLRLRKERMASSQRSNQSHQLPIDAYAYTKQTYRGSRNTKANEMVSSRSGEMLNRSSRSHRSANTREVPNQMVPYGKGQGQSSDMSLALAFAFENGGKLRRADSSYANSIMGFLHQIQRGTMEFGMTERRSKLDRQLASTSGYPTLSPVQINEISKGAQKLNQILRACSNGLNMDTYSIQFAKDLLRGAIDLEESLRMLVDLQKSSDFMSIPQKKNRITLLEEDNDDDEEDRTINISEQKQLARPTFSFDKPLRHTQNSQQVGKAIFMQRPITVTYYKEGRNSNNEKKKRSTSSSSDIKNLNAISERKNQTVSVQSNSEKGRIPNVIAKLMGLDNLPEKAESKHMPHKESSYMQKIEGNHGMTSKNTAKGSTKKTELKNKQTDNLIPMKNQKVIEAFKMPATQDEELMFGADKNMLIQNATSEVVVQNGKPLWRDLDGIKELKGFERISVKTDKHNNSSAQKNLIRESQKDVPVNGRKQDYTNNGEQKGTVKGRTNDPFLNNMLAQLEQVHERSEVKYLFQEQKEISGSTIQPEKRHANKHIMNNEKKSSNHLGVQKSYLLSKKGPQEGKHHREQRAQMREEQILSGMRPQRGSEMASKNSSRPPHQFINPQKKQLSMNQATPLKKNSGENVVAVKSEWFLSSHYDDHDVVRNEASNDTNEKVREIINKKSGRIPSPRDQEFERAKGRHGIKTLMDEKHVHKLASNKIKNTRMQKVDMPGKIDQVLAGRNGAKLITKQGKQHIPSLQEGRHRASDEFNVLKEAEQERVSMFREADALIISSSSESVAVPVAVPVAEPLDVRCQPHKEAQLPPILYSSGDGELQSLQESVTSVPNDLHYQDVQSVAINLQDQAVPLVADEGYNTAEVALHKINGIHEDRMVIDNHSQLRDQITSEISIQQPLTQSENCLKVILVMSQLFINTAEALFRLHIPHSVLQGGSMDNQDEGSKLILDCGYEVMKRKGIRQELKIHACSKISISTMNIRSLDDLVRQLNKDMEKLKFYGRNRSCQVDVEDYLPKMLEHDVYDKDPDIDCMWDLGWNDEIFAFIEKYDVIRDTEKHILGVLLDEITGELVHVQGGLNITNIH